MRRTIGGRFARADSDTVVSLRSGRGPRILMVAHGSGCPDCTAYVAQLAAERALIGEWGGRLTVVVDGAVAGDRAEFARGVEVLLAADAHDALGVGAPALMVVDEWGEVFATFEGGAEHDLPGAAEAIEWTRFVAIQCPECEQAEGEWRSLT